jgi:chloramphenicol-sensitive protein RarD
MRSDWQVKGEYNSTIPYSEGYVNKGIIYGVGAYLLWGFFPIYFKLVKAAPPIQILGHRIVWSFLFLGGIILVTQQLNAFKQASANWRTVVIYTIAAIFLSINWLTYIYAVNTDQVIESSLGYFINPLVSVIFGVVFLRERLRNMQWLSVGIAAMGVAYLTWDYGRLPWIALVLAVTFGLYGLIKKTAPLGALYGLTLETGVLLLPALAFLIWVWFQGESAFSSAGVGFDLLLAALGVITAVPLLMFGAAARRIPLTMVGLLQYIAPTCQFLLGVLVFQEPFSPSRLVGFAIIWTALALFWFEGYLHHRKIVTNTRLQKKPI